MAKPLPLSIHWVYTPAGKVAKLYETLPVDLIFVLFAFEFLSHVEDLDKLSHRESGPLTRKIRLPFNHVLVLMVRIWKCNQLEWLLRQYPAFPNALCDPIIRIDFSREVMLHTRQFLFFFRVTIIVETLFWYQTQHNSKAFYDISYLTTVRQDFIQVFLGCPLWQVKY